MFLVYFIRQMDKIDIISEDPEFQRTCSALGLASGIGFLPHPESPWLMSALRISLIPRVFPKHLYEHAQSLTGTIHKLVDVVSKNHQWLYDSLEGVCKSDPFTRRLCDISREVHSVSISDWDRDVCLFALRTDYMTTGNDQRILQVEVNTISTGFANISEQLSSLHKLATARLGGGYNLPINTPGTELASAIAHAHNFYTSKFNLNAGNARVLFIVEPSEKNEIDQRLLELTLFNNHGLLVDRKSLEACNTDCVLGSAGQLSAGETEYSIVYFRSGYSPKDYPTEIEWQARTLIEVSRAVKCPTIPGQLAGTKKIQQIWFSLPDKVFERFGLTVGRPDSEADRIRSVFAVQGDPSTDASMRASAIAHPADWVLKPQREGGGNNLFNDEMVVKLQSAKSEELKQYVLMERMRPNKAQALVSGNNADGSFTARVIPDAVTELGIFSVFMSQGGLDKTTGHMLRTKDASTDEGGVNAGFAYLDTISL